MPVTTRRRAAAIKASGRSAIKKPAPTKATRATATKPKKAATKDPKAKPAVKPKGRPHKALGPASPGVPGHRLFPGDATLGGSTVTSPTFKKKLKQVRKAATSKLGDDHTMVNQARTYQSELAKLVVELLENPHDAFSTVAEELRGAFSLLGAMHYGGVLVLEDGTVWAS